MTSFNAFSGTNSVLMLRAYVPESFKVEVTMSKDGPSAKIRSNTRKGRPLPKYSISKVKDSYLVSVTHP